jgi:aquaporin related protein
VRTTLAPGTSVTRGLFIEMFLTSMLMLTMSAFPSPPRLSRTDVIRRSLLLAAEKTKATFLAPIGIGLALFIAELLGVYYTGGSLNPARSFGPSVVLHTFETYHWIYWVGPALGALLAAGFYRLLKCASPHAHSGTR